MFFKYSTTQLMKIAGIGGFIVATTGLYMQYKITDRVRNYDYYKNALKTLRTHPGAVTLLGEPIKDKTFNLRISDANYSDGQNAHFEVPVSGPKQRGTYFFWAERLDGIWEITRAELGLKKEPERRLVIVKSKSPDFDGTYTNDVNL